MMQINFNNQLYLFLIKKIIWLIIFKLFFKTNDDKLKYSL